MDPSAVQPDFENSPDNEGVGDQDAETAGGEVDSQDEDAQSDITLQSDDRGPLDGEPILYKIAEQTQRIRSASSDGQLYPTASLKNRRALERRKEALDKYGKDNITRYDGATWVGKRDSIGHGSFGVARILVTLDDHGTIARRIVVKDSMYWQHEWADVGMWYKLHDPQEHTTNEIKAMQRLSGQVTGENNIDLLAYNLDEARMATRIIMNYCARGDLRSLIQKYNQAGRKIPEPFIW